MTKQGEVCKHGKLRRHCETCDLAEDVSRLEAERNALQAALIDINDGLRLALKDDIEGMERERIEYLYEQLEQERKAREMYAELAAGKCVIQKVIDVLGPQTLTSVARFKELEQAEAALAAAQKDAERWQYGTKHGFPRFHKKGATTTANPVWLYILHNNSFQFATANEAMDAAIDAAIRALKEPT